MKNFFVYNWQVRDEWLEWCEQVTEEVLLSERIGGVGSILYTLFHIVEVEYSWIRGIQGKEDIVIEFTEHNTLEKVKSLSYKLRKEIVTYFRETNVDEVKDEIVRVQWDKDSYTVDEVLHHLIAHEIHHIGQLSVWARELELQPISTNYIGRDLQSKTMKS